MLSLLPYIKPVALLLPPFIFLYFIFKNKLKEAFSFILIPYLFSSIWIFLIYKRTGYPGFSGIMPLNFYAYYVPFAKAMKEKISFSEAREKMSEELLKILPSDYKEKDLYSGMIKVSFKELKSSFGYFIISHFIFSLNTLISPISLKPLIFYTTGKEIKKPIQQEFFKLMLKGKISEGLKKFFNERIKLLNWKGFLILVFSVIFNTTFLILFIFKLKNDFSPNNLILFILFPLIFSTGILGEARFRVLFEILMIYYFSEKLKI